MKGYNVLYYTKNAMIFGLIYLVGFIMSLILAFLLTKSSKIQISRRLFIMTLLVSFWLLMEMISFVASPKWILLFQILKYIGVILVPPILLIATVIFVKKDNKMRVPQRLSVYVIPALSLLSIFTGHIPYPFFTDPLVVIKQGIPIFTYIKNIGFLINTLYSYIIILVSCYLLLIRFLKSPMIYRKQSLFVFLGCSTTMVMNVLFITQKVFILPVDTTPIFIVITLVVFYWGVYHLPKILIVPYARDLVIENIKDLLFVLDNDECIIDVNPTALEFIRIYADPVLKREASLSMLIGKSIYEVLRHIPQVKDLLLPLDSTNDNTVELMQDGDKKYYRINVEEIYDGDRLKIGTLYLLHDMTQIKEQLNHLIELNDELMISDKIINDAIEGIVITNSDNIILRVNEAMTKMSGFSRDELLGNNPRILKSNYHDALYYQDMWNQITTQGYWEGEIWDRRKTGEVYPKWMTVTTINHPDGSIANYIGISSDISKMKKAEHDIHLLAYYDTLTGIPNRTLFYDRLNTALSHVKRNNSKIALIYMDIDHFKLINDSLGHDTGDQMLIEVTKRIKSVIREEDILSRLGGDEFTLLIEDENCSEVAASLAEQIINEVNKPIILKEKEITASISIGISIAPIDDITMEGLIRKADSAMYHSKESGRGKYAFSSAEIERRNHEQLELQIMLKQALQNNEFELYLQPQISFVNDQYTIIGAEALIRWNRDSEVIPPGRFIPAAEENGLILPISNWLTSEIFRMDQRLKDHGINIKLAINVSVKQFENKDYIQLLRKLLEEHSLQNIQLVVEITESMFIHDLNRAIEYLLEMKELGIQIALDDFGTGFSSLSYLTRLPIDYLKIDRAFVSSMDETQNRKLTYSIISMAKTLNLKTLAEGVETPDQAEQLVEVGCDELQGYYFSKPITLDEFIAFYNKRNYQ
ncbi:MAG: diguanylate cyclase/phosphodiesterase with sensor(s) [Firmicutes bacterium]|nr:diguanylate cyclase/phosphodiesterase with sensor(s) [Bacillota bacterium]